MRSAMEIVCNVGAAGVLCSATPSHGIAGAGCAGAGIGFVAAYNIAHWPGVQPLLPMLKIPPLPCWLAVHREIRGSRVVRRVYDFLAEAIPRALAR